MVSGPYAYRARRPFRWVVRGALVALVGAAAVFTRGFTALPSTYVMSGESMAPELWPGDWFLARPLLGLPQHGDLVVVRHTIDDSLFHVLRRAVGLPGDTVAMREGTLWVNGLAPGWPARILVLQADRPLDGPIGGTLYDWGPVTVGPDSVFVLSDTRDFIGWPDSRFLGPIPRDRVVDQFVMVLRRGAR